MCGITGLVDFTMKSNPEQLKAMQSAVDHRGSDARGSNWNELESYQIEIAHTRLSILDLSKLGNQPMLFRDWVITLNGEIYNFKEIRSELIKLGHNFSSKSDTEVVLTSFAEWGMDCVNKFIGMFAFAIYDKVKNKLFLCRDRVGVKPLYIYWYKGLFLFGSELKSFHKHPEFNKEINEVAVM